MTTREANAFVARWRPVLCPEWEIAVKPGHDPSLAANEHHATMTPADDYLKATLYLGDVQGDVLEKREQWRVLLHELLHLTVNDLERVAKEPANALGYELNKLALENVDWQVERLVDRLACVLVDLA